MAATDHTQTAAGFASGHPTVSTSLEFKERSGSSSPVGDDLEKTAPPVIQEQSPRDVHGAKWFLAVLSVLLSVFLFALDNTIVADIQPAIVETFGQISKLSWLSVAFLVAALGTNLFWGKMYSQFDAKWLYLSAVFLFEAGSAICGAANSLDLLIFGRALCGLGGIGLYAGVMTLLSVTTTERERPLYISFTGLTWGLGTVLGPIIGGAFTSSSAGWRWGFYINLCVGGVLVPAWLFFLPKYDPRKGISLLPRFTEIDFAGTILILGAMVSGVMAIDFGGTTYPWRSGRIIGLFCTSGVLIILFALQQSLCIFTTAARRLFRIEFLTSSKEMILLFMAVACGSATIFTPIYFIPLYFQFVVNASAISAGVHLLPFVSVLVVFVIANGVIMGATGYYSPWFFGGGALSIIGSSLLYTIDATSSQARIYGYSVILGAGSGAFVQAAFSVAQAKVGATKIPDAIGFITFGQLFGATISLAIGNSVFLNHAARGIAVIVPTASSSTIFTAISRANSTFIHTLDPLTREKVIDVIVSSMSTAYIMPLTAGALVLVVSIFMNHGKMFTTGVVVA